MALLLTFIDADEAFWVRVYLKSEVFEVVKCMNCDKASRPDGFSIAFFQAF
jgi:hypothetical protein